MNYSGPDIVEICRVQFEPTAHIIKAHLESEGIPAYLRMETYGRLYGNILGGLGLVSIMVLQEHAEQAAHIITAQNFEQEQDEYEYEYDNEYEDKNDGEYKNKTIFSKIASLFWAIRLFLGGA